MSEIFKLKVEDFLKGFVVAAMVAILGALQQMVSGHGFDFGAYDWHMITEAVSLAFTAYIGKQFGTDSTGKFMGRIG
jgi:hypothetical protein